MENMGELKVPLKGILIGIGEPGRSVLNTTRNSKFPSQIWAYSGSYNTKFCS